MRARVEVKPALLRWAVERSGHGADTLVSRFPHLEEWLQSEASPTLTQLEGLAKATYTPIGFFFLPEPPFEQVPIPDFRTTAGPRAPRPSPDLLDTIYICQQRQEWYRDFARSMGEQPLSFVSSTRVTDDVVTAAAKIRDVLGFDLAARRAMSTWTDALRLFMEQADAAGIMVMCSGVVLNNNRRRLDPQEFRGFAMADDLAPVIFINGADSKCAQMFTLAHELAHICLGQSGLCDAVAGRGSDNDTESWCNQFAAALLAPLASLRAASQSPGRSCLTSAARASNRFAEALMASTWEGRSSFTEAFRLLGVKKMATFRGLGRTLGRAA